MTDMQNVDLTPESIADYGAYGYKDLKKHLGASVFRAFCMSINRYETVTPHFIPQESTKCFVQEDD